MKQLYHINIGNDIARATRNAKYIISSFDYAFRRLDARISSLEQKDLEEESILSSIALISREMISSRHKLHRLYDETSTLVDGFGAVRLEPPNFRTSWTSWKSYHRSTE